MLTTHVCYMQVFILICMGWVRWDGYGQGRVTNPTAYLTIIPLWGSKVSGGVNPSPTATVFDCSAFPGTAESVSCNKRLLLGEAVSVS